MDSSPGLTIYRVVINTDTYVLAASAMAAEDLVRKALIASGELAAEFHEADVSALPVERIEDVPSSRRGLMPMFGDRTIGQILTEGEDP